VAEGSEEVHQNKDETVEISELKQRIEELESVVSVLGTSTRVSKRKSKARKNRSVG
jgi:hypothetical protein